MATTVALLVGRDPPQRYSLHREYADSVWRVGATPVVLTPPPEPDAIARYVEAALACDCVCATGGGDVAPHQYGDKRREVLMDVDGSRDCAELAAVRAMLDAQKRVLGICRGIQLLAAGLGGNLHQDLPAAGYFGHWDEEHQHEPVHGVFADPGSLAAASLAGATTVNSIHHQAVADPGPRLAATAWSEDGLIEAVEGDRVLGVQWHPERLARGDARHLAAFRWLVGTAVAA